MQSTDIKNRLVKEATLLAVLGFFGFALLPVCIYFVGQAVFGEYAGGLGSFFGALHRELREGELGAWFLLFSPYLLWQFLRLTFGTFRHLGRGIGAAGADPGDAPGKL